jgi:hypothetical protein
MNNWKIAQMPRVGKPGFAGTEGKFQTPKFKL